MNKLIKREYSFQNPKTIWQQNRKQDANGYSYDKPSLEVTSAQVVLENVIKWAHKVINVV